MKRIFIIIAALAAFLAGCKPEIYTGPLDSPVGNWKSQESHYFFAGEEVYQDETGYYSAISIYRDTLCCIEGRKGTFKWKYSADSLIVDSTIWKVTELTGARMALDYLGRIERPASGNNPAVMPTADSGSDSGNDSGSDSGQTGTVPEGSNPPSGTENLPVEYKGKSIETDGKDHWYLDSEGKKVLCWKKVITKEDGSEEIVCWWDFRKDCYIPF